MAVELPAVSVVVVTYNSADQLDTCLDSLRAGCAGIRLVEVLVADNASSDATVKVAEKARDVPVRVVQLGRNGGYAAGINAALDIVDRDTVEAVLVLNPDITVRPGSVAHLAEALRKPGRAITVPKLLNPDGTVQPSLRRYPTLRRAVAEALLGGRTAARIGDLGELIYDPRHYEAAKPATWATGAALLISLDAAAEIGRWDESFLLYGEETEYALRTAERGWELWYEPDAVMEHVGGTQTVTNPDLFALLTVNRVRLFSRNHGRVASVAYHATITLGEVLRAATGRRPARAAVVALLRPSRRLRVLPG